MEYSSEILSIYDPVIPAIKFAIADAVNQSPKSNPTNFFGESLLIYDNPAGDKHSSPVVWKIYASINHTILTEAVVAPLGIVLAPKARATKPTPTTNSPKANFTAPEGFHIFSHILLKEEANVMMKKEFKI